MFRSPKNTPRAVHGGVMVETAICIPVLFIFAFGILQLGQALIQFNWVGRTAYNSALVATYTAEAEIENVVAGRTQDLRRLTHYQNCGAQFENCGATVSPGIQVSGGSNHYAELIDSQVTRRRSVRVDYNAASTETGGFLRILSFDMSIVGPYLLSGLDLDDTDSFANPSCVYGSCGRCNCGAGVGPPGLRSPKTFTSPKSDLIFRDGSTEPIEAAVPLPSG